MTNREVPMRMTLSRETESRETEPRETESRDSGLSIDVTPSGSDAAIRITVPPIDDERPELAPRDDERELALYDDEPTAITSAIGPRLEPQRLTPLPARGQPSRRERPTPPSGERPSRMTMSPVANDTASKKGGA